MLEKRYSVITLLLALMAGMLVFVPGLASVQDTVMSHDLIVNALVVFRWLTLTTMLVSMWLDQKG